jgi:hypothetical protein
MVGECDLCTPVHQHREAEQKRLMRAHEFTQTDFPAEESDDEAALQCTAFAAPWQSVFSYTLTRPALPRHHTWVGAHAALDLSADILHGFLADLRTVLGLAPEAPDLIAFKEGRRARAFPAPRVMPVPIETAGCCFLPFLAINRRKRLLADHAQRKKMNLLGQPTRGRRTCRHANARRAPDAHRLARRMAAGGVRRARSERRSAREKESSKVMIHVRQEGDPELHAQDRAELATLREEIALRDARDAEAARRGRERDVAADVMVAMLADVVARDALAACRYDANTARRWVLASETRDRTKADLTRALEEALARRAEAYLTRLAHDDKRAFDAARAVLGERSLAALADLVDARDANGVRLLGPLDVDEQLDTASDVEVEEYGGVAPVHGAGVTEAGKLAVDASESDDGPVAAEDEEEADRNACSDKVRHRSCTTQSPGLVCLDART